MAPREDITRTLCFFQSPPHGSEPEYIAETQEHPGQRNYPHQRVDVSISDIWGREAEFSLDTHSFAALPQQTFTSVDFKIPTEIQGKFLKEVEQMLLGCIAGAEKVVIFDHQIRRASCAKTAARQVRKIHIDQTPEAAHQRAQRHLNPEDAASIAAGRRFRLVNIWRPIEGPVVRDHPLTFTDCRTVCEADLVRVRQKYPDYTGETYALRHREGQKFYYWSDMATSDMLVLQCFDSQQHGTSEDGGAQHNQCAHGSFDLRDGGDKVYERTSIEVRCLVLC